MPKPGKRKGQQKAEAPKEPEPEPVPEEVEVEEESVGLGIATKRQQRKEKKQARQDTAKQAVAAISSRSSREKSDPPAEPVPEPEPEVKAEVKTEVEEVAEEMEGLGLGGAKRKKPKKPKKANVPAVETATPQAVAGSSTQVNTPPPLAYQQAVGPSVQQVASPPVSQMTSSTSFPPAEPVPEPEPEVKAEVKTEVEEVAEEMEGLGLGGAKRKKPKKPKKANVPAVETATPQAVAGSSTQVNTPPPLAYQQAVGPSVQQVASPPVSQMTSSTSFPPGFAVPEQTAPPVSSWGIGRGRGQSLGVGRGQAQLPISQSTPQFAPPPAQQRPVAPQPTRVVAPQPTRVVAPQPTRAVQQKPGQYSQDNIVCRYRIPNKVPGRLVNGRNIIVQTNYLEMTFQPLTISRYDVSFSPDRPKKLIPGVFNLLKKKFYPKELLAFDQTKNCYSLRPLKNVPPNERFNTSIEIVDVNGRLMKFEVSLKSTGVVELAKIQRYMKEKGASVLHPTEEVQCIDVILRQGTLESYVKAGRQFFRRPLEPVDLGHGFEMWTGLFQSAIFTSKAFINIDVAHKGFPKHQSMINAITRDFGLDINSPIERQRSYEIDNFHHFIKGLKVTAEMVGNSPNAGQKREFICNGLVDPPAKMRFLLNEADGKQRQITVAEYFAVEKKYKIKYPHFNCIWVGPKEKSIYFPVELLEVAYGQPLARQLNDTQVSKMVREAATPPDKRLKKITEVISSMQYSKNPNFKEFGLEISDKFYEVKAKILEPPLLDIGRGTIIPRKGQWQANHLLKPETLLHWGFIAVETSDRNDYENVIQLIVSTGKQMGMNISNPTLKRFDVTLTSLHNVLRGALDNGIKFVFVVVSARGRDHYHRVKQLAEREVGILTQCLKEATTRRMNMMTAKNILLKVNSKLMGINQALGDKTLPRCLKDGGVMIVGADVTHPSPEQSNVPSIAAVTASIDPRCYMYNIELSVQTPKKEMIVEFEDMMFDHLKLYKSRNMNKLPSKIFVFRDGVSEGQFVQVMNSELAAVHAAYARMAGETRKPEILFLLVQKRHHTRFFQKGPNSQYNVEPGTVVDTDIVHSSELDFYLVSHQALKGTARPTRYHAVCNDGRIPDDEVEQLTYYLCHLYSRCMRSVSYPTPTYYAHLACLRARSLTYGQKFNNKELEKKPERLHVLDKMLQFSRMFFV